MEGLCRLTNTRTQLIRVAGHLGVRLPASQPPPSPRQPTVVGHRGGKNGRSRFTEDEREKGRHDRHKTPSYRHSEDLVNEPQLRNQHNSDIDHFVKVLQLRSLRSFLHSEPHGNCRCTPTGISTTLSKNWTDVQCPNAQRSG